MNAVNERSLSTHKRKLSVVSKQSSGGGGVAKFVPYPSFSLKKLKNRERSKTPNSPIKQFDGISPRNSIKKSGTVKKKKTLSSALSTMKTPSTKNLTKSRPSSKIGKKNIVNKLNFPPILKNAKFMSQFNQP
jgi:hypothetical protein